MNPSLPPAVVFDCDGTIADTESLAAASWAEVLAARGYTATPEDFEAVLGHPFARNWEHFSERVDLGDPTTFRRELRGRFLARLEHDLQVHPDAVETMHGLADGGVLLAVASSSSRQSVHLVLEHAGVTALVRTVVGAEDVRAHKPAPEPYLRAANGIGVEPGDCVAVEDTPVGVEAAVRAGMFTVGIVRAHGSVRGLAGAHRVVERLTLGAMVPDGNERSAKGT